MPNLGEEICGEYLKYVKKCDFISYNVTNPDIQGEIDVIGINLAEKAIYVCEVAVHTSGLQYVTNSRPDDYNRFAAKFDKDINYASRYFPTYTIVPMLWSPIVRVSGEMAKYNTMQALEKVAEHIKQTYHLDLQLIVNKSFQEAMNALRGYTDKETAEFKSSVMRLFQIERTLEKHVRNLEKRGLN